MVKVAEHRHRIRTATGEIEFAVPLRSAAMWVLPSSGYCRVVNVAFCAETSLNVVAHAKLKTKRAIVGRLAFHFPIMVFMAEAL